MEVKFDSLNRLQVTATTVDEATALMAMAYGSPKEKKERKDNGGTHVPRKNKTRYAKSCPVEGCDVKAKSIGLHLRMKHGILPDGEIRSSFFQATKGEMKVSCPVVSDGNGGYVLKERKVGLLDSFSSNRTVIN